MYLSDVLGFFVFFFYFKKIAYNFVKAVANNGLKLQTIIFET